MGRTSAPAYARIFILKFERKFLQLSDQTKINLNMTNSQETSEI